MAMKLNGGDVCPKLTFPKLGGGTLSVGGPSDRWTLFVVYRGKHCPKCKAYLNKLDAMADKWREAGIDIVVTSADPEAKAKADQEEFGWGFDLGHSLSEDQMRELGLFISDPLSPEENDRRFAEPGLFVIRSEGTLQIIDISNGPASRPDLEVLLDGMIFTIETGRPPRGTVV